MKKLSQRKAPRPEIALPSVKLTKLRVDELDKVAGGFKINSYDE